MSDFLLSKAVMRHASCTRSAASEGAERFAGGVRRAWLYSQMRFSPPASLMNSTILRARRAPRVGARTREGALQGRRTAPKACATRDGLDLRTRRGRCLVHALGGFVVATTLTEHDDLEAEGEREARAKDRNAAGAHIGNP